MKIVEEALARNSVPAECLELEVNERCLTSAGDQFQAVLAGLVALGVGVAIDDFGSGYGWLPYLGDARAATIKIDKSLFGNGSDRAKRARIVEAIVAMARRLDIQVAAKGIDTADLLTVARSCGCDLAQGEYLGAAMSANEFRSFTARKPSFVPADA